MEETNHNTPTSSSPNSSPTNDSPNSSPTNDSPTSDNPTSGPTNDHRTHHTTTTSTDSTEHSDSTMSNPVNDKVDTSEKSGESAEDNTPFDLSYFDGIYKTKEKDDPLDLSYFESPYDKNKLEDYLKSNAESGNQLAYNSEDFTEGKNRIDNIQINSNPLYEAIFNERESFNNTKNAVNSILGDMYRDVNSGGTVRNRLIESLDMINDVIDRRASSDRGDISSPYDEAFNKLKREIEFAKEKAEDINTNGVTKNTGISAESERQQIENSLAPAKERLMSAYESGSPIEIENAKQAYERVANRVKQEFEGSDVMENNWRNVSNPETFYQKLEEEYGPAPTEEEYESEAPTETSVPARAESVPETPTSTPSSTDEDLTSVTRERQSAEEEMYNTLGGLLGGGVDSFIDRLLREDNYDNMSSAEEIDNAIRGHFYGLNGNSYRALANWIDAKNRERRARESLARGTSTRTETPASTSTSSSTEDDLRTATEERTLAAMDLAEALRTSPSNIEDSDTARALQSGEFGNITSAEEMRRAMIEDGGFPLDESTDAWARWAAAQNRERRAREALASTSRETHEERDVTPTEEPWVSESETPETPTSTETPTEIASTEGTSETSEDEIPEGIDTEPSEETHDVMEAMAHLDDSGRWWEFGSEDYERTRHQIARISPTAEEEFMDFADLINNVVNGSAGDKVKAVLKLISKAAWDTFNILPKVCVDIAKDIVYRLIKGDYDTSGLTEGEQKQVERFSHNKQNVNMMNAMLNTMDKPINSSVRGKGRGQATDESDYNEGLIEQTNEVVSDVTKKYIINHPWVFKAIKRW